MEKGKIVIVTKVGQLIKAIEQEIKKGVEKGQPAGKRDNVTKRGNVK